ncbi:MAG: UDPGP type 1 family protein [Opitutales bacterium]|nr:UDPGP type 1 family protein [Opitutales bacterium]
MSSQSAESVRARFEEAGQAHVFRFWDELSEGSRASLLEQAEEIDLGELGDLVAKFAAGDGDEGPALAGLEPAPYIPHPRHGGSPEEWAAARRLGEEAIRAGRVGAFTVAGGQGTRLGYDGPKGTFPVTPVTKKTLFQVFAEKIQAAERRYAARIPWFVMTSHANHAATVAAFEGAGYYGLSADRVSFFTQGRMPAVDRNGKILLEAKDRIAMSPDGHGGSLRALVRSGAVAKMRAAGVDTLSYFQVDNPLVRCVDPAFIGFHLRAGSEMSSKMIPKAYPEEKVGHFCRRDGTTVVIEYSDMPMEMQRERDESGRLRFVAGSIAIHILDVGFVARVGGGESGSELLFHRAEKKIPCVGEDGDVVKPEEPNGIKFEMFVFDALPFAENAVIIETLRQDDFSPVKNADGKDSPRSAVEDQLRQFARWVLAVGVELPVDDTGLPAFAFEVSPFFADDEEAFAKRWAALKEKPVIKEGAVLED